MEKVVAEVKRHNPKVLGIGVYIWNVHYVEELVGMVREELPEVFVVVGGPEVSHELEGQPLEELADFVVQGEGEQAFRELCERLLSGERPKSRIVAGHTPPMAELQLPYRLYTDEDIANRVIYVEASRGCPYRCEFCLSSLDKRVRDVDLTRFFEAMNVLWQRGVRDFKFIDRTFNLSLKFSLQVLRFFLEKSDPVRSLHFEMVPERLPTELLETLAQFEPGVVQLEVGVQTLNEAVARHISRPMNVERIARNLSALRTHTGVHLHVDLIVGLPGEDLESFGSGLDQLFGLQPQEIQVGVLKRLKGTPLQRHTDTFAMSYSERAPFEILETSEVAAEDMVSMKRFAHYWDRFVNSGQFSGSIGLVWHEQESVYESFKDFSSWLFHDLGRVSHNSLIRLAEKLFEYLTEVRGLDRQSVGSRIAVDLKRTPGRHLPSTLKPYAPSGPKPLGMVDASGADGLRRQQRHQLATSS